MITLAEIADKMPSVSETWGYGLIISLPFIAAAMIHRVVAHIVLVIAACVSLWLAGMAYSEAFVETFGEHIWRELGGAWVGHSIAASFSPLFSVLGVELGWLIVNRRSQTLLSVR